MPRYIDADKLKEKAEKAHFYDEAGFDAPERAVRESDIDSIPTETQDVFDKIIEDIFRAVAPSFLKDWKEDTTAKTNLDRLKSK